ncbi:hypothetical protein [Acetivibrio ethanolgignens]|uniref:Uncharacterized protein n=1 Tax=Acetivibrio ethanolgignens TaxID=290052 RepID=A0A0V8QG86_9FIRM|nr:hypothetical protein [Acetivibrio ethanolgignens]KSV59583.1 hypothetical protein ASU35_00905 [Acetivibrio ethanolgignens]
MMFLLEIKERIKEFYYKNKTFVEPVWKFVAAIIVFMIIKQQLGYNDKLASIPVIMVLALIAAFTSSSIFVFLSCILTIGLVFSASMILAVIVALVYVVMYCMVLRFTLKFSYVLVLTPILFVLKIPYCIPLIMGIISTPIAILPVSCGIIVYYMFLVIQTTANTTFGVSMEDALNIYKIVAGGVFSNKEMLVDLLVFAIALLITYIIRRQVINHAFEIGIGAGTIVVIVGSLAGRMVFDTGNISTVVIGTVISGLIALGVWFFRMGLDYTAVERIQFEDDDYYYYVKAVPKLSITAPEKNVKRINNPNPSGGFEEES